MQLLGSRVKHSVAIPSPAGAIPSESYLSPARDHYLQSGPRTQCLDPRRAIALQTQVGTTRGHGDDRLEAPYGSSRQHDPAQEELQSRLERPQAGLGDSPGEESD